MIWRVLTSLVILPALVAGGLLSLSEMRTGGVCPAVGPIPACYLVVSGYLLIFASLWVRPSWGAALFAAGFVAVFGLAATGVFLEVTQGGVCPRSAGGIPQCYFSFAIALLALLGFVLVCVSAVRKSGA